jgi:hypothetical protein
MVSRSGPRFFIGLFGMTAALLALASLIAPGSPRSFAASKRGEASLRVPPRRFASAGAPIAMTALVTTLSARPAPDAADSLASSRSASELRGVVRDATGHPISEALVRGITLARASEGASPPEIIETLAVTDRQGAFVARVGPGDYAIFATKANRSSAVIEPISVAPGEAVDALDLVINGPAKVAGLVVDAAGHPIAAAITLRRALHAGRLEHGTRASKEGRFTFFELPDTALELEARDLTTGASGRVQLEHPDEHAIVRLGAAPGELRVTVIDETGAPLANATVHANDVDGSHGWFGFVGDDGRAILRPRATHLRITATTDDGSSAPVEVELDERPLEVEVRVERRGSVRGRILKPSGAAAVGTVALVPLERAAKDLRQEVDLDESGAFRFAPLPAGRYEIHWEGPELLGEAITQGFTIVGREDRVLPDLRPRGGRVVEGVVVDESGAPIAEADVSVVDGRTESLAHAVTTDDEGRFTLPGEVFGTVHVRAEGPGVVSAVTAVEERASTVTLVARGFGHVTGVLRGRLTADSRVRCTDGLWHPVDAAGQYSLSCPPGATIEVEAGDARRSFPVELEEEEQTYLELRI